MTNPGGMRALGWKTTPLGMVKVAVTRGYDCRATCEHVPALPNEGGENHGQHCDEWLFELRIGNAAAALQCFSWVMNGRNTRTGLRRAYLRGKVARPAVFDYLSYRGLAIYGARLIVHRKCDPGAWAAEQCPIFEHCVCDFAGYLNSANFFTGEHCAALLPLALHPVDEIDLHAVVDAMRPLWSKLVGFIAAKAED